MTEKTRADRKTDQDAPPSWTERFYRTVPVSPVWVGVGIVVGLLAVFLAIVTFPNYR